MRVAKKRGFELFDELEMSPVEHELLEVMKLDEDALYRMMGAAARETIDSLRAERTYEESPNIGDTEGKSPFFFRNPKVSTISPSVYGDLPVDDLEVGKLVHDQIKVPLDRIICETVSNSPLSEYKQAALRLGAKCVAGIRGRYPKVDERIVRAFVAMHVNGQFGSCTVW